MKRSLLASLKKVFLGLFVLSSFCFVLAACKTQIPEPEDPDEPSGPVDPEPEDVKPVYTPVDDSDLENMTALQFTQIMGNGINLGNTMEACGSWIGFTPSKITDYEQMWGQPVTTAEMFVAMKSAGFDCVRIPVAWTHTMDWSRGNYKISSDYLDRVATVVNYALDAGLYVMINEHWDRGWWGMFSHDEATAWKIYEAIWSQVGEYFKDYDYRLIFEGGNEEHGEALNGALVCDANKYVKVVEKEGQVLYTGNVDARLTGIDYPEKGTLTEDQIYEMSNKINQKFVDIIRSQGSKNAKRFLLIPGINTSVTLTCDDRYKMPTDSANEVQKLIVSVHHYEPATYAIVSDKDNSWGYSDSWGTESEVKAQNASFYKMTKFTKAGYGVIIGEYAAAEKDKADGGGKKDGMNEWITNILDNCDTYGYCPFLWDCNGFFKKNGVDVLGFQDATLAALYKGRNYAAEKAGTSTGGTIDYKVGAKLTLYPNTKEDGMEATVTLGTPIEVKAGQTVEFSFERGEILNDYAGHVVNLYDSAGNMIKSSSGAWCSMVTYPVKGAGAVTLSLTVKEDVAINKYTVYIGGAGLCAAGSFEITNFIIEVK